MFSSSCRIQTKQELTSGFIIAAHAAVVMAVCRSEAQRSSRISPTWVWDEDTENPTLEPSILSDKNKGGCGWHGYLRKGIWVQA